MKDPLLSLAPAELRDISMAIRSGRLAAPFTSVKLQRFVGGDHGEALAKRLAAFSELGMVEPGLAACLDTVADAMQSRRSLEDCVDLVTTGPEAGGVANRGTAVVVGDMFRNAQRSILIAGYAIYQGQKIFAELANRLRDNPHLDVRMFLDVQQPRNETSDMRNQVARFAAEFRNRHWPQNMPLPQVYCCESFLDHARAKRACLHAKCIVVDTEDIFVSSANFTEAAQERNIEVGLLVHSTVIAERVQRFFDSLLQTGIFSRAI